jgi:hypothetical protein
MYIYVCANLIIRSCLGLLGEHVQKLSKKLTAQIVRLLHLKCKEKFVSLVPSRDSRL